MHIQLKMKYLFNQIRCHFETVLKLMVFLVEGMKLKVFETASPLFIACPLDVCLCVYLHIWSAEPQVLREPNTLRHMPAEI